MLGRFIVCSQRASCCALYELEEVEAGLMQWPYQPPYSQPLIGHYKLCLSGPQRGSSGDILGGRRYPLYSLPTSSIRAPQALTDIAQPFLALVG